jgi:D-alanine transaminase
VLLAPIKNHLMLPGITYDVILELARAARPAASSARHHRSRDARRRRTLDVFLDQGSAAHRGSRRQESRRRRYGGTVLRAMYAWYQTFKDDGDAGGGDDPRQRCSNFPAIFRSKSWA